MNWSIPLGRLRGIPVRIHWTFFLLVGWVVLRQGLQHPSLAAVFMAAVFVSLVFGCVLLHELGHALLARHFRIGTRDITLWPFGGIARIERFPEVPSQEFSIAVAGPLVNLAIALVLAALLRLSGPLTVAIAVPLSMRSMLSNLMWINMLIFVFNLIPAFPMDGGRILRSLVALRTGMLPATQVAKRLGQGVAILFGVIGLLVPLPVLVIIAVVVFWGAESEWHAARVNYLLDGLCVRDAMVTRFTTLTPHQTLGHAADEILTGGQQHFPIVEHGRCQGILHRDDLLKGLHKQGPGGRLSDVASAMPVRVYAHHDLRQTLEIMSRQKVRVVPVYRNDTVVGMLTLENVAELVMVRAAIKKIDPESAEVLARQQDGTSSREMSLGVAP